MPYSYPYPYENAWQEIIDRLIHQVYYRLLGMAPVLTDFQTTYDACKFLSENVRGGKLSLVINNRLAQWDDLYISPGLPDSPTMSMWVLAVANRTNQKRCLLVRKGFWTLYLPNYLGFASAVQHFKLPSQSEEQLLTPYISR